MGMGAAVPDEPAPPAGPAWPEGRFAGRADFRDLLAEGMACAAQAGSQTLWLCDPDFAAWPLGERRLLQALDAWGLSTRSSPVAQLRLLGQSYGDMRLRHGRFVAWRSLWSHRVQARAPASEVEALPSLLWTPEWVLQRVDTERDIGVATCEAAQRTRVKEWLQGLWQTARPAFPDTPLGL
jgi:hypothetical protein